MTDTMNRREFIGGAVAASVLPTFAAESKRELIWATFQPFGRNMWSDVPVPYWGRNKGDTPENRKALSGVVAADHLRFEEEAWRRIADKMVASGVTMAVMDVGEALAYPSHPELHVKGSWAPERVRVEVERCRKLGLELIPKLNFSTGHDIWLKDYHRMVSTPTYYRVCADVLKDVWEAFDHPRLIHLGYDEEDAGNQSLYGYCVVRQGDLWWHDFLYISGLVEKLGARPWIWSDYCWYHQEDFLKRMPKSVLQSNWYYGREFDLSKITNDNTRRRVSSYSVLAKAGFDQMPCGSTHANDENFPNTVRHCRDLISPEHLKGFLMAPWCGATVAKNVPAYSHAADIIAAAMKVWREG